MTYDNSTPAPPPSPGAPPVETATPVPFTPGTPPVTPAKVSVISWIALGVAVLGFIIACVPGGILFAWLPLLAALILAIIGLAKRGRKWAPLTALILSVVGGIVGVITLFAGLAVAVNSAIEDTTGTSVEQPAGTDEDATEEAPAEQAGTSRDNPAPIGSKISGDEWDVVVNSVTLGATDEVLAAESMLNDAPSEGNEYILINVTTTYTGPDKSMPAMVQIAYVTPEGNTVDGLEDFAVAPEPLDQMSELYTDASATGNIVLSVPSATAADGVLVVTPGMFADDIFVAVK